MTSVCHCTNQCKACGACCQVCQGQCRTNWSPHQSVPTIPGRLVPNTIPQPQVGDFKFVPQAPVDEETLKRLIREALAEAIEELRQLKDAA